jgi:hypothetical protein
MYQLTLPHQWKIHNVFHVDLLTPYIETEFHGPNYTRPPPDLMDGEEEYKVKKILKSRHYGWGRKIQYLVKWKGYPDSDNEWVNWDDMHADEALEEFKLIQPEAVTHKRAIQMMAEDLSPTTLMSNNVSTIASTSSRAQDLAEAIAHFPAVIPGSPDHSLASPITIFTCTPSPAGTPEQPITVSSRSPSPGAVPWLPLTVFSCQPSPYMLTDPRPTPEKGVDRVPVHLWVQGLAPPSLVPLSTITILPPLHHPTYLPRRP